MSQTRPQLSAFKVNWAADDPHEVPAHLRYPFSDSDIPRGEIPILIIPCRKFVPGRKDVLTEAWRGDEGTEAGIGFPPYACVR